MSFTVLHVAPNHPPEFRGGVERHVETLVRALPEFGVTPVVACGSEERRERSECVASRHDGVDVFRLHRRRGDDYTVAARHDELGVLFESVLERVRPDVVHVHHWFNVGLGIVGRCTARGIPVVVTLHDVWTSCARFFRVIGGRFCEVAHGIDTCGPCVEREAGLAPDRLRAAIVERESAIARELASAAAVVAPSCALREFLAPQLASARRIEVVPHGVPESLHAPVAPRADGPPWRIGGWGGVVAEKGVHLLVAAAQAMAPHVAIELHWWGHAPDAAYVRELRALDRRRALRLHEPFAPEDLPSRAAELHVAAFPSICFESFGLAVEEALALHVPVVVGDRGAPRERVGPAGLVARADDADSLRAALESILTQPELRRRLASAPRRIRTTRDVARDLAALYRDVSAAGGGAAAAGGRTAGSPSDSGGGGTPPK